MNSTDIFLVIIAGILIIAIIMVGFIADDVSKINEYLMESEEYKYEYTYETEDSDDLYFANQKVLEEFSQLQIENEKLKQKISELNGNTNFDEILKDNVDDTVPLSNKERLPEGMTNTFRCEPYEVPIRDDNGEITGYKSAFNSKSEQYKMQQEAMTDPETGIRFLYIDKEPYYCVALGGAYGIIIGDTWEVTLANGEMFNIIQADFKHPIDNVDPNDFGDADVNYDGKECTNVIEFIYDLRVAPKSVIHLGTMSALERFGGLYGNGGNIVSMKYLERKWEP